MSIFRKLPYKRRYTHRHHRFHFEYFIARWYYIGYHCMVWQKRQTLVGIFKMMTSHCKKVIIFEIPLALFMVTLRSISCNIVRNINDFFSFEVFLECMCRLHNIMLYMKFKHAIHAIMYLEKVNGNT